jgi:hypothetical protein
MKTIEGGRADGISRWAWQDPASRLVPAVTEIRQLYAGTDDPVAQREIGDAESMLARLASSVRRTTNTTELGWRFDPDEPRDAHGRWTHGGTGYTVPDTGRLSIPRPAHPSKPYYGHPRDHPFFAAHPVSSKNIVDAYDKASPEEKAQGMRWYADAHTLAKAIGGGDVTKGAGLLASYSPQSAWPVNMFNAARAMELGRAIGPGEGMITGSMQHHAEKAMNGLGTDENFGKGAPKIRAFARLIEHGGDEPGDTEGQVVLDRHAMSVAMGVRLAKTESDKAPIDKERYYQHVADQYRIAALEISRRGTPVTPHQVQAITWLRQQRANAVEDKAGGVGHGGKGAGKGRQVMISRAWQNWQKLEQEAHYPVVSGTTELAATIAAQLDMTGDGHGHHIPGSPTIYRHGWKKVSDNPAELLLEHMRSMAPHEQTRYRATGELPERMSQMRLPEPKTPPGQAWLAEQRRLLTMWTLSFRTRNTTQGTPRDAEFINELHRMYHGPLYPPVPSDCGPGCQDAHRFMTMVDRSATAMPMELARGFSFDTDKVNEDYAEGKTVDLPLASWTKSAAVASSYASRRPPRPGKTKVILRAEPGSQGMDLTPVEKGGGYWMNLQAQQDEVLTGGRYTVMRTETQGDQLHVFLRQEDFRAQ